MLSNCVKWVVATRCIHSSVSTLKAAAGPVAALRKKTGYPFTKCKMALGMFDNDIDKAEAWMREQAQKEGWARATKLGERPMSRGQVAVVVQAGRAAMVEVNCETDFVAMNPKFRSLVEAAASACLQHGATLDQTQVCCLPGAEVASLRAACGTPLADRVALAVGDLGENMAVRRAVCVHALPGQTVGSYVHSTEASSDKSSGCRMGKYGALVLFRLTDCGGSVSPEKIGYDLGLHIVGMNPLTVGSPPPAALEEATPIAETSSGDVEEAGDAAGKKKKKSKKPKQKKKEAVDETSMLSQAFVVDDSLTVGEYLEQEGACVDGFVRFECGEEVAPAANQSGEALAPAASESDKAAPRLEVAG